jgi:BMFP domain-containing protein YqiC
MQTRNRLFDDAARIAGGAVGTLAGAKREIEALVRQQLERMLSSLDLVTRDEFEAVKEMAAKARSEQEVLADRLASVESLLAKQKTAAKKPSSPRATKETPEEKTADE